MFLFLSFVLVIYLINISPYHHFVNTLYLFQCVGSLVTFLNLRETILCRRHFFFPAARSSLFTPDMCSKYTLYVWSVSPSIVAWCLPLLYCQVELAPCPLGYQVLHFTVESGSIVPRALSQCSWLEVLLLVPTCWWVDTSRL